jgi:hypothetical protein
MKPKNELLYLISVLFVMFLSAEAHAVEVDASLIVLPVMGTQTSVLDPKDTGLGVSIKFTQTITMKTAAFFDVQVLSGNGGADSEAKGSLGIYTTAVKGLPPNAKLVALVDFASRIDGCVSCEGDSVSTLYFKLTAPIK